MYSDRQKELRVFLWQLQQSISIYEVFVIPEDNVFDVSELQEFSKNIRELLDFKGVVLSEKVYRYSWGRNDVDLI